MGYLLAVGITFFSFSLASAQSLTELAKREKERREKIVAEGKDAAVEFTNVIYGGEVLEPVPVFDTMDEYEDELQDVFERLRSICEGWKEVAFECQGRLPYYTEKRRCTGPDILEWRAYTTRNYRSYVVSEWGSACRERFDQQTASFQRTQKLYDILYRDYTKLAAEKGKLGEVRTRLIGKVR